MSQVRLTVMQIKNLGLWDKVCEYKGYNPWILNEGRISYDDYIEFDDEFKKEENEKKKLFKMICPECEADDASISKSIYDDYVITCNKCGFKESEY